MRKMYYLCTRKKTRIHVARRMFSEIKEGKSPLLYALENTEPARDSEVFFGNPQKNEK